MKVNFDIECTPQEARAFFGLPNVEALQETMMKELEARMLENIRSLDPETMLKTWLPATMQGWGEMQKMFWDQMGMGMPGAGPGKTASGQKSGGSKSQGSGSKSK